ncbi:MAG TPA: flagellar hook-basal body complex protein [Candidatus Binataceae bacterium]|nr:flagellar hook-basal body complex protein [Candidatus Binataceae bacterium]
MDGLYLAASGAASELAALDVSTNNLANASVPGYRRFVEIMKSVTGNGSPYEFADSAPATQISTAQGPIFPSGNPLDVAIAGPAFIAVQTPDGPAYTRNGELQRAADGTLIAAGQPVLGANGGTIVLPAGPMTIGGDGSINVNSQPVGKMQLGDATGIEMVPAGSSLYKALNGDPLPAPQKISNFVRQGFLEGSAGSAIGAMVSMTGLVRNYESAMRAVQAIDDNQSRTIQAFTLSA